MSSSPRRNRSAQVAALLVAPILLGSCATLRPHEAASPPYAPPTEGPTARLLMRGTLQPTGTYGVFLYSEPYDCRGAQRVGFGTPQANPPATTLAAGRVATVDVVFAKRDAAGKMGDWCLVRWSFYPKEGHAYVVAGEQMDSACRAMIADATDPDDVKAESTAVRRNFASQPCVQMSKIQLARARDRKEGAAAAASSPPASGVKPAAELSKHPLDADLKGLIGSAS